MKLLRGTKKIQGFAKGTVATIGNFDGVHLGHQSLLSQLTKQAVRRNLPSVVLLFEPQPAEFFQTTSAPARLSSFREKLQLFAQYQIDYVCCLSFNQTFSTMSPIDFAHYYFFSWLNANYLLVGEDFHFGSKRLGNVELLAKLAINYQCIVDIFADFTIDNERVSSTKIRSILANSQLEYAAHLLGRPYQLSGRVIRGDGRGRQWGIPTANISIHRLVLPLKGVFCVHVHYQNKKIINGIANLGYRPTVGGIKNVLEVHLFDFDDNLYGERLNVIFLQKLRDEIKFSSIDELIAQIKNDITTAKAAFNTGLSAINTTIVPRD
jgi:riboflavin kinase/FMN adenylyltransferase